jgi:UDP-glucose:(heptosyl)LPS alpha-1,3-glucosyltransferase
MAAMYQGADLFVYPSAYDTFGMVVAEAMACGLPVVIGKNIGAAEWIRDGENGFLCEAETLVATLKNVRALSGAQLQLVSEHARETAALNGWDECAQRTMALYQRAISNKRSNR